MNERHNNESTTGSEELKKHIAGLAPGTALDVVELAQEFGLDERYVRRLFSELENATVCHLGYDEYTRMISDLTDPASPGDVVKSFEAGKSGSVVTPGRSTHTTSVRARHIGRP